MSIVSKWLFSVPSNIKGDCVRSRKPRKSQNVNLLGLQVFKSVKPK